MLTNLQARHPGATLLVEGAGGLLVRLGRGWTIVDLARRLDAPLLVVTSLGLGSLNAADLTVTVARDRGLRVLGLTGVELLATLPTGAAGLDRTAFAALARARLPKVVAAIRAVD